MSTQILPVGEIILTNERELIGAGYDYGLRSGPPGNPAFDSGSFSLTGNGPDRKLRFDHCFILTPESIPWVPATDDLKRFFRFILEKESGEIVTDVVFDFAADPKYLFHNLVHYINGHGSPYNVPAPVEKTPNGKYILTCLVNHALVNCMPAVFYLEFFGEDSWMYAPPVRSDVFLNPFRAGVVTREMLNPAAPPPKPA